MSVLPQAWYTHFFVIYLIISIFFLNHDTYANGYKKDI